MTPTIPKVRQFVWRACKGIIPTFDALGKRVLKLTQGVLDVQNQLKQLFMPLEIANGLEIFGKVFLKFHAKDSMIGGT